MSDVKQELKPEQASAQKRRSRPSKSQRALMRESGSSTPADVAFPTQPHPSTSSSRASQASSFAMAARSSVESSAPAFRPGSFPVVFNAGAPEASVDIWFSPNISTVGEHAAECFDSLAQNDRFSEFVANVDAVTSDAATELESQFEGAGILCAAQSILESHKTGGFPVGDFSPLASAELVHVRSVRQIMAQYGDVRFDRVGQRYSVVHYNQTVKAFIRQARKAFLAKSRISRSNHRTCWWLPVERSDPRTRFILAQRIAKLVASRDVGFIPDVSKLETKVLPATNGEAPVWLASVFSTDELATLSPLWDAFPDAAGFVRTFGTDGSAIRELLDLAWVQPAVGDLYWTVNWKQCITDVTDPWSRRAAPLRRFFSVESSSMVSRSTGSTAQLGESVLYNGVTITSLSLENGPAISSLAAAFFPAALFDPRKEVSVKLTTTAPVRERAVAWVQLDIK